MAFTEPKAPRPEVAPRGQEFGMGTHPMEMPGKANMGSLSMDSMQQNALVPHGVQPHILDPMLPTGNGMAAADAERQYIGGGMAMSPNGQSYNNWRATQNYNSRRTEGI